jgi:hypothetical protein
VNRDDLLKMLDLDGKDIMPEEDAKELAIKPSIPTPPPAPTTPPSPTALVLDVWGCTPGRGAARL